MQLHNWYSFEDDEHTYGYTLFYPLKIEERRFRKYIYGLAIICNDWGGWTDMIIGSLESTLEDAAAEFYDKRGNQPKGKDLIQMLFEKSLNFRHNHIN